MKHARCLLVRSDITLIAARVRQIALNHKWSGFLWVAKVLIVAADVRALRKVGGGAGEVVELGLTLSGGADGYRGVPVPQ